MSTKPTTYQNSYRATSIPANLNRAWSNKAFRSPPKAGNSGMGSEYINLSNHSVKHVPLTSYLSKGQNLHID